MAVGLQIFDANGSVILDTSSYVLKAYSITVDSANGSVSIPTIGNTTPAVLATVDFGQSNANALPVISISGNTASYSFSSANPYNAKINVMLV